MEETNTNNCSLGELPEDIQRWTVPRLLDVFLVFLLVFGVFLTSSVDTAILVELVLAVLSLTYARALMGVVPQLLFGILVLALIYAALVYLDNGLVDSSYPLKFARALVAFAAILWFVKRTVRQRRLQGEQSWVYFSDLILLILTLHGLVIVAEFLYHPFRDFIYMHWSLYPGDRLPPWRAIGLTKGGAMMSYMQVIGFFIAMDKIARRKTTYGPLLLMVMGVVCLGVVVLMAQTGVLFFALSVVPFCLTFSIREGTRLLRYFAPAILLLGVVTVFVVEVNLDPVTRENIEMAWQQQTDLVANFFREGVLRNYSFDEIRYNMYFFPNSAGVLLFGNSLGLREGNESSPLDHLRVDSDVGYVTNIWGIGLVGTAISVTFYLVLLFYGLNLWRRGVCRGGPIVLIVTTGFFLAGHAKEVHLFARSGFEILLMLFWSLYVSRSPAGPSLVGSSGETATAGIEEGGQPREALDGLPARSELA